MAGPRLFYTIVGMALAVSLGGAASAQEGGKGEGRRGGRGGFGGMGGFGGTMNRPTLLGSAQVRTELKVTDEQGKKLDEVLASYRESSREFRRGGGPGEGSDEERKKAREENAKKSAELLKTTDAKLAGILDKTQSKRLDEIVLQQQGVDALVTEPVVAALSLKTEQVDKIKAAFATRDEEMAKLRPAGGRRGGDGGGGGGNFEEMRAKIDKLRKDTDTTVLAVLSKEQSESFTKLKGAPFELDRQALFQGGGGGRGGPGGGGGGGGGGKKARPPDDEI